MSTYHDEVQEMRMLVVKANQKAHWLRDSADEFEKIYYNRLRTLLLNAESIIEELKGEIYKANRHNMKM